MPASGRHCRRTAEVRAARQVRRVCELRAGSACRRACHAELVEVAAVAAAAEPAAQPAGKLRPKHPPWILAMTRIRSPRAARDGGAAAAAVAGMRARRGTAAVPVSPRAPALARLTAALAPGAAATLAQARVSASGTLTRTLGDAARADSGGAGAPVPPAGRRGTAGGAGGRRTARGGRAGRAVARGDQRKRRAAPGRRLQLHETAGAARLACARWPAERVRRQRDCSACATSQYCMRDKVRG